MEVFSQWDSRVHRVNSVSPSGRAEMLLRSRLLRVTRLGCCLCNSPAKTDTFLFRRKRISLSANFLLKPHYQSQIKGCLCFCILALFLAATYHKKGCLSSHDELFVTNTGDLNIISTPTAFVFAIWHLRDVSRIYCTFQGQLQINGKDCRRSKCHREDTDQGVS